MSNKSSKKFLKIFVSFIAVQIVLFIIAWIHDYLIATKGLEGISEFESVTEKVLSVLVVGPIIETLIFNLLLNELFFKFIKKQAWVILLSSLLFGGSHFYSWSYILYGVLGGLVYNYFYFKVRTEYNYKIATLLVFLLHFNHNGIGLLLGK